MSQKVKLLFLVANLVFVRLALANTSSSRQQPLSSSGLPTDTSQLIGGRNSSSSHQDQPQLGAGLFDQINSLDFAPNEQTTNATSTSSSSSATISQNGHLDSNLMSGNSGNPRVQPGKAETQAERPKRVKVAKSSMGPTNRRHAVPSTIPQLLISLLGQLEKVDVKRIIMDSFAQMRSGADSTAGPAAAASASVSLQGQRQTKRRSSGHGSGSKPDQDTTSGATNHTKASPTPTKERIDVSSLAGDTGNLLSITKQLVRLARSQVLGGAEFGSPSSWFGPAGMGMLSGAGGGHFGSGLDSAGHDFTAAGFKSDWFWLVVPAVIVVGAGVIVVPLIAAWLVSQMMGHNTFTVSAGRRRRRRDVNSTQTDPLAFESTHKDLFNMLDIHRFLDDPQFLIEKLGKFQAALDSTGSSFRKSAAAPVGRPMDRKKL